MRLVRYAELPVAPWKNGGGVTREIVAALDADGELAWRVSIATIDRPGPFSRLARIDRTIAVLDGAGIVLSGPDGEVQLTPGDLPYRFAGETEIAAALLAGPTRDLNAMTRRGRFRHRMTRLDMAAGDTLGAETEHCVLVLAAPARITVGGVVLEAETGDALVGPMGQDAVWFDQSTLVYRIEISPEPLHAE